MDPTFMWSDICKNIFHFSLLKWLVIFSIIGNAKFLNELVCYYDSKESIFYFYRSKQN